MEDKQDAEDIDDLSELVTAKVLIGVVFISCLAVCTALLSAVRAVVPGRSKPEKLHSRESRNG